MSSPGPGDVGRQGAEAVSGSSPGPRESRRSIAGLARRISSIGGWRRWLLAAGFGALASAALPPLYVLPLAVVAFTGLVWLIDGAAAARSPARSAFAAGWWFGFGHFMTGLYWITNALLVDAAKFGWLVPFAVAGLSAYFAVFPALAALAVRLCGAKGLGRVLALAVAWTAFEWLRGHVLTGFPWNLSGTVWAWSEAMIQTAAATGAYGLSLLTVAVAAVPATLADAGPGCAGAGTSRVRRWGAVIGMAGLLGAVWVAGEIRLAGAPGKAIPDRPGEAGAALVPEVRLRLVQANIDQRLKWRADQRAANLLKHLRMSAGPGSDRVTHVIWPEAAAPYVIARDAAARGAIAAVTPPRGVVITGAPRVTPPGVAPFRAWNSILAVDERGQVVATYDKYHLVPFGEYVPLGRYLPLTKITPGRVDLSAGPGPTTLELPGLPPVSPLICYEAIFPGEVLDPEKRPEWLLNLTNDGWFGASTGPHQHFAGARLRAVEEGLPLVRAANTGISAVLDPYGRVIGRLGLGVEGVLDSPLPAPLDGLTLYARFGDWILLGLLLVAAYLARLASRA